MLEIRIFNNRKREEDSSSFKGKLTDYLGINNDQWSFLI